MTRRTSDQRGFTLVVTMLVMSVCAALGVAAFTAVLGDIPLRKTSKDRKAAYAAAEAGLNFYLSRLNQDNEYWARCTTVTAPNASEPSPVNQRWDGAGAEDPRRWRVVPGDSAKYTIELLPSVGATCDTANPSGTMLDPSTGTLRIRATGEAGGRKRSIIASLRRRGFLDYLYFTDYETTDPAMYGAYAGYAQYFCAKYRPARANRYFPCQEIQFASGDDINGPFHTNDDILACGGATFGRSAADRLEAHGAAPGYRNPGGSGCNAGPPDFKSVWQTGAPSLPIPTSNDKITSVAQSAYTYTGTTRLVLSGTSMSVTKANGTTSSVALPSNGVIWVKDGSGCGSGDSPAVQDYDEPSGCANVRVSGTYNSSLTIVSDKDIIVDGNLKRGNEASLLGLIATQFVRVYHPVKRTRDSNGNVTSCTDSTTPVTPKNIQIDAAMLTLQHSFVVDNHNCGSSLGTLTVRGAIAQVFRGPVGTTSGTGYLKNYNYDDRMRYRNPPYFLEPVSAAWRLLRQNEQVPAR